MPGPTPRAGRRQPRPLPPTRGWGLLAAVCAAALLITFGRTVHQAVAQSQERRAHDLWTAELQGRCNTIAGPRARADCRAAAR